MPTTVEELQNMPAEISREILLTDAEINFIMIGFLSKITSNPLSEAHQAVTELTKSIAQKFSLATKSPG